uniref:DNA topoisomerase n=1 Tax=Musa acuminata subsp. malaccensis TaxID=214687 RepID=A0A804KR68_MUSAM|nr:PREDICTED: uncharacterized protein LOC103999822 [Musa acuminata subsp. malaccensis]
MAFQLHRLFVTSSSRMNLSYPLRLPPMMLQYRLGRNFPSTCLPNSLLVNNKNNGRHAHLMVKTVKFNLSRLEAVKVAIRLPQQIKLGNCSSPITGSNFTCRTLGADNCSRMNYFAGELVTGRLFSSNSRKIIQYRASPKHIDKTQVLEKKNIGDGDSAPNVLRGLKKKEKKSTCNGISRKTNTTASKPPKRGSVTDRKTNNMISNTAEHEKKFVKVVKKKKEPAKRSSNDKDAKAPEKNQKDSSKKKEQLSGTATTIKGSKRRSGKKLLSVMARPSEAKVTHQKPSTGGVESQRMQFKPLYPPTGKSVVVVESATKAKVIQNYLGNMYEVLPSYGHVRDLAARSKSVRPDDDFSMVWEVPDAAWTHLKSIEAALKGAENLILASDPDREGEAIAWHITEMLHQQDALNGNIIIVRVVFHEITESSIRNALQDPREIDMNLVNAYLARRVLDYLIGFSISPLLWRKLPGCQSAGRVQSAALALICDREMEIEQFKEQEYWTVVVEFQDANLLNINTSIPSHLTHLNSKKLDQLSIGSHAEAEAVEKQVLSSKFAVKNIKTSKVHRNPPMPYITSNLQQDSANKLHFTASYTMKLAQKLYEGVKLSNEEATGLITYMRTDGLHVCNEAAEDIHSLIKERYGEEYASKSIRKSFQKVKNAQEAHEAIRPTSIRRLPSSLVGILDGDSLKLYTLIWSRTMACQMEAATTDMIQADIENSQGDMIFRSVGSRLAFLGYQAVYEDKEAQLNENNKEEDKNEASFEAFRKLKVKDSLDLVKVHLLQHYTKPPPRYSEGALVKKLEELGIGRPSTYASIMKVLQDRNYISMKSRILYPEFRGRMVSAFLSHHFSEVADYSFTADMENELDNVCAGTTEWKGLLKDYWSRFSKYCDLAGKCDARQVEKMLEETFGHILFASLRSRECPSCSEGTLKFKVSRFGAGYFIGCNQHPRCKYIASTLFSDNDEVGTTDNSEKSFPIPSKLLGLNPGSSEKIYLKKGPYGYYVQLGEDRQGFVPKRASLSEVKDVEALTLEDAIQLLQYPITLGNHPEDNHPVVLTYSKFGYSIRHRRTIAPVPKRLDPKEITLEVGLKLLVSKTAKQFGRRKGKSKTEEALWE